MTIDRSLISNAVIVMGLCVGSWMILVKPKARDVRALEASMAEFGQAAQAMDQALFEKTVQRVQSVKSRVKEIESRNGLMRDSSRLYGQIMDLAAANKVRVQNLQPGTEKLSADGRYSVARIDMTAEGEFANVTQFLDSIQSIEAFIRPVSLSMTPIRRTDSTGVTAQFTCEAVSFKIPETLTAMGGDHAKP